MDKWRELQRFYKEWSQIKQHDKNPKAFKFTSADGKHHIYMHQSNEYTYDESLEWYIEVYDIVCEKHEIVDTTFSPINDEGYLMVQIAWCIAKYW